MAAGIVLVREAGGYVSDCDGGEAMLDKGSVCVGSEATQKAVLALLHERLTRSCEKHAAGLSR